MKSQLLFGILTLLVPSYSFELLDFTCPSVGRFADPLDCEKYYTCTDIGFGVIVAKLKSCSNGNAFDEVSGGCNLPPDSVPGCNAGLSAAAASLSLGDSTHCASNQPFACASCYELVTCSNGNAYVSFCDDGELCLNSSTFGGGICMSAALINNSCSCVSQETNFVGDPYNPEKFSYCYNSTSRDRYTCPVGEVFSNSAQRCVPSDGPVDTTPACSDYGIYVNPANCTNYYSCIRSRENWIKKWKTCPNDFYYNTETETCVTPCSMAIAAHNCTQNGRFPDPFDCKNYYECINVGGIFISERKRCPNGLDWKPDPTDATTGNCVMPTESTCTVKKPVCNLPANC